MADASVLSAHARSRARRCADAPPSFTQPPRKRVRSAARAARTSYHVAGPGPPTPAPASHALPDEVLVCILSFIDDASLLARLRTVCSQWCRVIDASPLIWRHVSFRGASFRRRVAYRDKHLALSQRCGRRAVALASRAGNVCARFVHSFLFERRTMSAVTIAQPVASMLVSGSAHLQARPFAPCSHAMPSDGVWIGVHAARWSDSAPHAAALSVDSEQTSLRGASARSHVSDAHSQALRARLPGGAVVGVIHVSEAVYCARGDTASAPCWIWRIDRAVRLRRAVRCAGFVGLWPMSSFLSEFVVQAVVAQ